MYCLQSSQSNVVFIHIFMYSRVRHNFFSLPFHRDAPSAYEVLTPMVSLSMSTYAFHFNDQQSLICCIFSTVEVCYNNKQMRIYTNVIHFQYFIIFLLVWDRNEFNHCVVYTTIFFSKCNSILFIRPCLILFEFKIFQDILF